VSVKVVVVFPKSEKMPPIEKELREGAPVDPQETYAFDEHRRRST
jgi:hypothetical protein